MGLNEIKEILRCPVCLGPLKDRPEERAMDCPECKLRFTVDGDILNLIPAQALELEKP